MKIRLSVSFKMLNRLIVWSGFQFFMQNNKRTIDLTSDQMRIGIKWRRSG